MGDNWALIWDINDYGLYGTTVLCLEKQMQEESQTELRKLELSGEEMDDGKLSWAIKKILKNKKAKSKLGMALYGTPPRPPFYFPFND